MITKTDLRINRGDSSTLHVHYRHNDNGEARPTVIFSHGFTVDGAESHRMFLEVADQYNELNITTINFDYYGAGYSDGDYSQFSLSGAVRDLGCVIDWAKQQPEVEPTKIVVHGQSLGTAVATIVGSCRSDVNGFVLWNLSADLPRRYRAMLGEEVFTQGHTWVRDKGYMIRREFMEDIEQYDILAYYNSWRWPTLFVSSGDDAKGEPVLAEQACSTIGELGTRIIIPGANHSFKCQPELQLQAAEASVSWVKKRLGL